jgi:glycosyltransferase involved in cell wall biosynthesis
VLIGLHAVHSRETLLAWRYGPRVAVITGTDLRGDQRELALDTLARVEAIIALQPLDLEALPAALVARSRVILPSVELPETLAWTGQESRTACCVGHLREVKAPLTLPTALQLEPSWRGVHLGGELERGWAARMHGWDRFRWLGELPRSRALRLMSRCGCFVIPSHAEGCSNALCEAVALGMPILASDIPGNRGLLGDDFSGYFPPGEARDLACKLRGPLPRPSPQLTRRLAPQREAAELCDLLIDLSGA